MSFVTGLKTIVVATDLSGQSDAALDYARKLAANYGARIVLAHGADPLEYADVEGLPGRVRKDLTEEARKVLKGSIATPRFARARLRRCCWMWRGNTRPDLS
jgi:nucleotide-binding universal stress UspA family protein